MYGPMGHGLIGLLLSLAAGYWVFERASERKGDVKRVGRLLGGTIIVLSLGTIAAALWALNSDGISCPFMKGSRVGLGGMHPYRMQASPDGEQEVQVQRKKR